MTGPSHTTDSWHTTEQIQRIVRRRRLRRGLASGAVVLAVAGTTIGLSVDQPVDHHRRPRTSPIAIAPSAHVGERLSGAVQLVGDTTPLTRPDPAATTAVAQADSALTVALLQHANLLTSDGGGPNVSTSPFSLYVALAMLQNGARGTTASQIADALQASGVSLTTQNAGLAQLSSDLSTAAGQDEITLETANSLWQQQGVDIKPAFLSAIATYFHAGVWQTDFVGHNAQALAAINAWTAEKTHGKITRLFDQLDPDTILVLANALYFHAAWQTPFIARETEAGPFTTAAGKIAQPMLMTGSGLGTQAAGYQAAVLPYQGGRFEALAVMPSGTSLPTFVDGLSAVTLNAIATSAESGTTQEVILPRFTTTASTDLVPALKALGMTLAFGNADLTGISGGDLSVAQVRQRVYLGVGEQGTTAAAVTGIGISATSATNEPAALRFDHPFLFLIRDKQTGTILFASEINDPTAG